MLHLAKTNNLNYLIDPTFNKFNRLFVLSFENHRRSYNIFFISFKSSNKKVQCIN